MPTSQTGPAYDRQKRQQARRSRDAIADINDIAPLPAIVSPERRRTATRSFTAFCLDYFPDEFEYPFSRDHYRVIAKIERAVKQRMQLAIAMPRSSGKTTLCLAAAIWAVLTGQHPYVVLVCAIQELAEARLEMLKKQLLTNARLLEDFPESIYPIRKVDNEPRKCRGQRHYGRPTYIEWNSSSVVMPTIPGSPSSGAILEAYGLSAAIRGAVRAVPGGGNIRPSLVICDDPQTDESAKSAIQSHDRFELINGTIRGLAHPGKGMGVIVPCTVIQQGDLAYQLLDRKTNPQWQGERTKMVYRWPDNEKLWHAYAEIRAQSLRNDGDGSEATQFYREHRAEMDAGAEVAWDAHFEHAGEKELSTIQHAWNLRLDDERTFMAEYQQDPMPAGGAATHRLTPSDVAGRVNGYHQGEVPLGCRTLTAFVDIHDTILFYAVVAWRPDATGYVVDYGTWPEQAQRWFTLATIGRSLAVEYPGATLDDSIMQGFRDLATALIGKSWEVTEGGGLARIERLFVDMGYKPDVVGTVQYQLRGSPIMLYKGMGIRAASKPISEYTRRPGWVIGEHWFVPNVQKTREFPHIVSDVNHWKTEVHRKFHLSVADRESLSVWGRDAGRHAPLGEHVAASESWTLTHGRGRDVHEWKILPTRPDNHWFDCLVGCTCGANYLGIHGATAQAKKIRRPRRPIRQLEI